MCGRFALTSTAEDIAEYMGLAGYDEGTGDFPARFNIAPTQPVLAVTETENPDPRRNIPPRRSVLLRWGFIPGWVKDPADFPLLINARSETAISKASFRAAMRHRRVLIPASGFYEWKRPPKGTEGRSQACWIRPRNGGIVAFAGLMETWASADGSEVDTGAILTTAANASLREVHDRMPVVIAPDDFERWLDCRTREPRTVTDLLRPAEEGLFEVIPVSDLVNKVSNTGPVIQQASEPVAALQNAGSSRSGRSTPPGGGNAAGGTDEQLQLRLF